MAEALEADGHEVYVAIVPPYDSPEVRAVALAEVVDAALCVSVGAHEASMRYRVSGHRILRATETSRSVEVTGG